MGGVIPYYAYNITSRNIKGLVYIPFPPDSYDAIAWVEPIFVESSGPFVITSEEFDDAYSLSSKNGYLFDVYFDIRGVIPKQPELPTEIQPVEDPQIEPEPKQDTPSGIPGFGIESIITGILSSAIILMIFRRAREQVYGIET